jgi:hypothetical protein
MSYTLPRLPDSKPAADPNPNTAKIPGGLSVMNVFVALINGAVLGFGTWVLLLAVHVHLPFVTIWLAWLVLLLSVITISSLWNNTMHREAMKFAQELAATAAMSAELAAHAADIMMDDDNTVNALKDAVRKASGT